MEVFPVNSASFAAFLKKYFVYEKKIFWKDIRSESLSFLKRFFIHTCQIIFGIQESIFGWGSVISVKLVNQEV